MSCGAEGLLLALKLATGLVEPRADPDLAIISIPAVCGCECITTESGRLRCQANRIEAASERAAEHNRKVKEFWQMVGMCGLNKPQR